MANFVFDQPSAEIEDGTDSNDLFLASNNNLNAGDRAFGKLGIDDFQYFADASLTGGSFGFNVFGTLGTTNTFAAFILNSVETFTTVNDSGRTLVFDLSSSSGITDLVVANSTSAVVYDQVTSLANVRLVNQTNVASTNVAVGYAASLTGGTNDSVNLVLDSTSGNIVRLGTAGAVGQPSNSGIETVRLSGLNGDSVIGRLDTNLTTLFIDDAAGAFDITISNALNTTVRTITSATDGDVTLSFANNGVGEGVAYTGSNTLSANTVVGGAGNDVFNTFGGNDTINAGAGNDTINVGDGANRVLTGTGVNSVTSGSGRDIIYAQGSNDTVTSGLGDDVVNARANGQLTFTGGDGSDLVIADGTFNASVGNDSLNFGANFDVLIVGAGTTNAQYAQVSGLESVALLNAGTTTLGSAAQAAGINTVFLGSGTAGNDVVDASTFTSALTIQAASSNSATTDAALETTQGLQDRFAVYTAGGGDDTITTGSGTDFFLFRGDNALTSADVLNAGTNGGGVGIVGDTLVLNGDTTLAGGGFAGFEFVALESVASRAAVNYPGATNDGNVYNLTLTNANAPTSGRLFINGSALLAVGGAVSVAESVTINAAGVTGFGLDVTTGAAGDTITLGTQSSVVSTQGGNDTVNDGAGNDVIDSGLGNDTVNLLSGNNTVFDAGGSNTITLGTGNDSVFVGGGADTIVAGANLTGADVLVDGGGYDVVRIGGRNYTDADFAGVNTGGFVGFEELEVSGAFTYTLGANAQRAGFTVIEAADAAASTINLAAWTRAVTVDLSAGGDDVVVLGTAAPGTENVVLAGTGTQNVTGGTGVDVLRVQGAELDATDFFAGGAGIDRVELDNAGGAVTADVTLANFLGVERYVLTADGERAPNPDADANSITFRNAPLTTVNSLTQIVVDSSALTDNEDSFTVTLDASLQDADFAFDIIGNAVSTTLVKNNGGINNNIFLVGGSGVDTFIALGGDFGATTSFDGNGGTEDRILLSGGTISDDGFVNVSEVEVLGAIAGQTVQATLGTEASQAGLVRIDGTTGNDNVLFDPAFTTAITVNLGGGGDDVINATATAAVITFNATMAEMTAADLLFGGTTANDVLNLTAPDASTAANITSVVGVETVNVIVPTTNSPFDLLTLTLDTAIGEVAGGRQVINVVSPVDNHDFVLQGGSATANLTVNSAQGWDSIRTGSGDDVINTGSGNNQVNAGLGTDTVNGGSGVDRIYGGLGSDTVNGDAGNDQITGDDGASAASGGGNDALNGGAGNDIIRGESGNDTIRGGADNDTIYGGVGADTLFGDAGTDVYLYADLADSPFNGRDTVHVDAADVFDFRGLTGATGTSVAFKGSYTTFEDSQSAVVAGDGIIDVVYNQASNRLWVDINDDGTLDGNDLQINIVFVDGATDITAANIAQGAVNPTLISDFNAQFTAPFAP